MKKALSIILAIALVATMLPSVAFATEPHVINYKFALEEVNYEGTDKNLAITSANGIASNWAFQGKTGLSNSTIYGRGDEGFLKITTSKEVIYGYVWLTIDVDKAATYKLSTVYNSSGNYNGGLKVYIFNEETRTGNGWETVVNMKKAISKLQPIDNRAIDTKNSGEYISEENITLEKGTYNLYLYLEGVPQPDVAGPNIVRTQANIKSFTLTEVTPKNASALSGNVGVGVSAYAGGSVALSMNGEATDVIKSDVAAGTEFCATATADEGYKFAYWKDSAGKVVSTNASYTFNAYSNTALVAVFDSKTGENTVEFFDADGNYIASVKGIADGAKFSEITLPEIENNNYAFTGWSIDGDTEIRGVMRAVAEVEVPKGAITNVTVTTPNGTDTSVSYGQEFAVSSSAGDFGAWARNNKLISFDRDYTYYAFDSATINEINGFATKGAPIVILDTHNSSDYADTYMLEYDAVGKTIVEAGIIFGDDTHNTVSSCYYKAKVRNIKEHGQFIARTPDDTTKTWEKARGYIIYREGSDFVVKYSD